MIRIASRGSKLSLIQVETVVRALREFVDDEFEVKVIRTKGDRELDRPLYELGGKGLFEAEVNQAVLRGEADVAVHSLKDIPAQLSEGLTIAMVTERLDPRDAVVSRGGFSLRGLPKGARVGTSSLRRRGFALSVRQDLEVIPIRGNVDTRLRKLESLDAVIMASAALSRMGISDYSINPIPVEDMPPAPGQGIIAVVARRDSPLIPLLGRANHPETAAAAAAERAFLVEAGAGCHVPLGGVALLDGGKLSFVAGVVGLNGDGKIMKVVDAPISEAEDVGRRVARELLAAARERGLNLY